MSAQTHSESCFHTLFRREPPPAGPLLLGREGDMPGPLSPAAIFGEKGTLEAKVKALKEADAPLVDVLDEVPGLL